MSTSQSHTLLDVDAVLGLASRLRAVAERLRRDGAPGEPVRARWSDAVVRISGLGSVDTARAEAELSRLERELDDALGPTGDG